MTDVPMNAHPGSAYAVKSTASEHLLPPLRTLLTDIYDRTIMIPVFLEVFVICSASWLLWKYFRQVVVKSPLDNIPGPPTGSFLYGNYKQLVGRDGWDFLRHLIDSYPGIAKLHGPLGRRILYVFDPTAMYNIIVKDQYIFEEAEWFIKTNDLLLGPGLLSTLGDHHRKQRKLLNPVFSIAHMRRMIPMFNAVGHRLVKAIDDRVRDKDVPVELDMLSWMGRTALELIGQAGLGYSFDPLTADSPDEFAQAVKAFMPMSMSITFLRRMMPYIPDFGSPALRRWLVRFIPNPDAKKMQEIVDIMWRGSTEIYQAKKLALEQGDETVTRQVGEGKDLMSILLRANMNAEEQDKLPEVELIGQISTFIFAAMDTTSNALSMTLSLLAEHPEVQQRLRQEILEASQGKDLDYDTLTSLPYLDAVCRETLRLHAPIAQVFRETRQDVVLPLSEPIRGLDGKMIQDIPIPKDTTVMVGLLASNQNKRIWGEDALEWKPERWLSPLPGGVTDAKIPGVYSNLMTFLGGGRACIGFKFSQLEMKVVLCLLLSKFTFAKSDKEVTWMLAGVRYPTVGDAGKASLPMKVALYKPGSA
ncbi:cytochrome P450 [Lentinus tigrinus ALCF2SS1-7]|uniref:cytochrome P450 n=1 Tax=Lentinus tigrinus ALCF2SS1-7 TaxID=1328758 RepID=UPI0011663CC0|nr:cytochrome P450 [Lentinus tigrinus ALCF2SS1-7]